MSQEVDVCVVGLGYIGLPTASLLAMGGFQVLGVDIRHDVVDVINAGKVHFSEPDLDMVVQAAVASGRLRASAQAVVADVYVIAVPTPLQENRQPDLSCIHAALDSISHVVRAGSLVILESTSPVGTTDAIRDSLATLRPDLVWNGRLSVDIAHCPERVLPGRMLKELVENDRIVGGVDARSTARAAGFYRGFVHGQVMETDAKTAEMTKLTENAFRDVNIAFANELSMICERIGVDVWDLIGFANHHPRVNILSPGPGVGGHCIAVDPWFIAAAAPEESQLIQQARLVNDGKRDFIVSKVMKTVAQGAGKRVACLGLAFKADVDDLRESPAVYIVEQLQRQALDVCVCEPMLQDGAGPPACLSSVGWIDDPAEAIAWADVVVLLVNHKAFTAIGADTLRSKAVIDTRGIWPQIELQSTSTPDEAGASKQEHVLVGKGAAV